LISLQIHGVWVPFKAHNAKHPTSNPVKRRGPAWDLFDMLFATAKRAWAFAQVDIALKDGRRFLLAEKEKGSLEASRCSDMVAYIQELETDAVKLFGVTVEGSGVFTGAGTMSKTRTAVTTFQRYESSVSMSVVGPIRQHLHQNMVGFSETQHALR
jgi:hypothetical protein